MDFQQQDYLNLLRDQGKEIAAALLAGDFLASRIIQLILKTRREPEDPITWGLLMSALDDWRARHENARH